jgi:hypothetical protein
MGVLNQIEEKSHRRSFNGLSGGGPLFQFNPEIKVKK